MNFFLFVCALFVLFYGAYSAVSIQLADPDHPGHCYSEETGQMSYGEQSPLKRCGIATCNKDGSIQFAGCGAVGSPCKKTIQDLTKPYPDCCPVPAC